MSGIQLTIVTEDELSEAVLDRLVKESARFEVVQRLRRGGWMCGEPVLFRTLELNRQRREAIRFESQKFSCS